MKVLLDVELCQGYVCCLVEAPSVFDVDEQRGKAVLLQAEVPGALREPVEAAARACPTRAIRLVET